MTNPESDEPFDLQRFIAAQSGVYDAALREIRRGQKQSHWMWFIFPQLAGLGWSETARYYAIGSLAEARAYLDHPVLGARLRTCIKALQDLRDRSAEQVFGAVDAMKLCSSLTLFAEASDERLFRAALDRWCGGRCDGRTLELLQRASSS